MPSVPRMLHALSLKELLLKCITLMLPSVPEACCSNFDLKREGIRDLFLHVFSPLHMSRLLLRAGDKRAMADMRADIWGV